MDRCLLCGMEWGIEYHHIFEGPFRKKSTKYGLVVPLCVFCHRVGRDSIHEGYTDLARKRKELLKKYGQSKVMHEQGWTKEDFIREFGRNYL